MSAEESNTGSKNETKSKPDSEPLPDDVWMLRPCNIYKAEYDDCISWKGRIHQKYVYGENLHCDKWKENYLNCQKFRQTRSLESLKKVLENEKDRLKERLDQSLKNDVWEKRTKPPEDWNSPMPESWMEERKYSLLTAAQNGDDLRVNFEMNRVRCVIL